MSSMSVIVHTRVDGDTITEISVGSLIDTLRDPSSFDPRVHQAAWRDHVDRLLA